MKSASKLKDNTDKSRFELEGEHGEVYADYGFDGDQLVIKYVFAAPELRGSGAASRLMQEIVDHAEAKSLTIVPLCGYAAAWMQRHER